MLIFNGGKIQKYLVLQKSEEEITFDIRRVGKGRAQGAQAPLLEIKKFSF